MHINVYELNINVFGTFIGSLYVNVYFIIINLI